MVPSMQTKQPHTQQPQQHAYQLGTTTAVPMQVDTTGTHPPTGPTMPEQPPSAATAVVSQVTSGQQAQQPQQALPIELAQHASAAAAAVPSSLHWGLFSAQATTQGSLQLPGALALPPSASVDPQQHQPEACEEMPEKPVPGDTTWMQLYSAPGASHGQGNFGQALGQDRLAQPWAHAVCAEAGPLPPALAQQDPNTGQWVPTLMPLNPFVIDQLAKADGTPTCFTGQPQSSPEGLLVAAYPNGWRAVASKKRARASPQLPLAAEPNASIPARALPAVDRLVLDRMYEDTPAQLASSPSPSHYTAAGSRAVIMGSMHQYHAAGNAQQWHSQTQADGSMPSSLTHAGPNLDPQKPPALNVVIDLCSPTARRHPQHQQHDGSGPRLQETAGHSQLWHYGKQPIADPGTAHQQPTSRLHKELTEFAVMASATQVGWTKNTLMYCISSRLASRGLSKLLDCVQHSAALILSHAICLLNVQVNTSFCILLCHIIYCCSRLNYGVDTVLWVACMLAS